MARCTKGYMDVLFLWDGARVANMWHGLKLAWVGPVANRGGSREHSRRERADRPAANEAGSSVGPGARKSKWQVRQGKRSGTSLREGAVLNGAAASPKVGSRVQSAWKMT